MTNVNFADRICLSVEDGVAEVTLTRPDKFNALDLAMFDALGDVGDEINQRRDIRAVVLRGEGKAFCAGLDMSLFNDTEVFQDLTARTHGPTNRFQRAVWVWHNLPVPVIAAIQGVAFGGGLQLTLGADIRLAHAESQWSVMEVKWGLVPDMTFTLLAPSLVREDVMRELVYTGRIFSGLEAQQMGFVTRVVDDPVADARLLAKHIAAQSPDAIRAAKHLFSHPSPTVEEGLLAESRAVAALMNAPNQREAVLANVQKRPPNFTD